MAVVHTQKLISAFIGMKKNMEEVTTVWFLFILDTRQAFLLVASRNQIVQDDITTQPNVVRSLVRDGRNIVALDFDSVSDRVYWSDTSQDRIWSCHKNGSHRTVVRQ